MESRGRGLASHCIRDAVPEESFTRFQLVAISIIFMDVKGFHETSWISMHFMGRGVGIALLPRCCPTRKLYSLPGGSYHRFIDSFQLLSSIQRFIDSSDLGAVLAGWAGLGWLAGWLAGWLHWLG